MAEQWASLSSRRCSLSRYYRPPLHEPSNASERFHNNVIIRQLKCPSVLRNGIKKRKNILITKTNWVRSVKAIFFSGRMECHFSLGKIRKSRNSGNSRKTGIPVKQVQVSPTFLWTRNSSIIFCLIPKPEMITNYQLYTYQFCNQHRVWWRREHCPDHPRYPSLSPHHWSAGWCHFWQPRNEITW